MKQKFLRLTTGVLIILSLMLPIAAYALGDTVYTNSRWIANNLEYMNSISYSSAQGRTESFAVRMTGKGDAYPIVMNGDTIWGTRTVTGMVNYAEGLGKNVLAAVNTDFFFTGSRQGGVPLGIVVEDGIYKSSSGGRNAVTFGNDGNVNIIPPPSVRFTFQNNGGAANVDNSGKSLWLTTFNKIRTDTGGMVLYSEAFSTVSTRTSSAGWFVKFKIVEGKPTVSGKMTLRVTEKIKSGDAIPIGAGNMVLTAADKSNLDAEYAKFAVGDVITLTTTCADSRLVNAVQASGGGDIIVSGGAKTPSSGWSSSLMSRAPRTAFGVRADGSIVSFVIDGRNSSHSVGLTLNELADDMLRQGCVYAINFDGGGSSMLSVRLPGDRRAAVVNKPSDGSERKCATFVLFVTDIKAGGAATKLNLKNNGAIVLANSSLTLTYAATDKGYMPAAVPDDIKVTPLAAGASCDGSWYTTGSLAGPQLVELYSASTGAAGTGEIYVITQPTSMTASRKGSTAQLSSVSLTMGETLELNVSSSYYSRYVTSQLSTYKYSVTGNIGEMISPGVFKAGFDVGETGTITISAGSKSISIKVTIDTFTDMRNHWAKEYTEYLARKGITFGVSATQYGPEQLMKRGDYILMLHRAAGLPANSTISSFDDVPVNSYYALAIAWAKNAGIADSLYGNSFEPESPVSRQDAFTFTYKALDYLDKQYTDGTAGDLARFPDAGEIADYAVVPTATLVRLGIIEGSGGMLVPLSTLTRAEMAKILTVLLKL